MRSVEDILQTMLQLRALWATRMLEARLAIIVMV
jgi:hypothetical protein